MLDFCLMQLHLAQYKQQVADMEQLLQAQQQEHKAQLVQANQLQRTQLEDVHQQLYQALTDNEKLNDDVLTKAQQVKQYKKQVDGLKAEKENYKSQRKEEVSCVLCLQFSWTKELTACKDWVELTTARISRAVHIYGNDCTRH